MRVLAAPDARVDRVLADLDGVGGLPHPVGKKLRRALRRALRSQTKAIEEALDRAALVLSLPWRPREPERFDPAHLAQAPDRSHGGLERIKKRLIEVLSACPQTRGPLTVEGLLEGTGAEPGRPGRAPRPVRDPALVPCLAAPGVGPGGQGKPPTRLLALLDPARCSEFRDVYIDGCTSDLWCAVSCGGVSSFPEAFEAAAEDAAAQGEDGIGAVYGPVHAGALEACPDGMFAAGFDDAGGDAQAPGPERGIAHALTVADEIVDAFAGLVAGWGVLCEGGDDGADAAGIEFITSLFRPLRGELGPGCVDGLGDVPEVAFGVEDVDDLDRIGETLVGEGPDHMLRATYDLEHRRRAVSRRHRDR